MSKRNLTPERLEPLHERWRAQLSTMIADGSDPVCAVETMLTIALAGKLQLDGPRAAARALFVVASALAHDAERHEAADASASRH